MLWYSQPQRKPSRVASIDRTSKTRGEYVADPAANQANVLDG
jgi:hypothetical protein